MSRNVPFEAIVEFENRHAISLPDEYRAFLLRSDAGERFFARCFAHVEAGGIDYSLASPFPFIQAWNLWPEDSAGDDGYAHWEEEYNSDRHICGTLFLCGTGCGHYAMLIVTGAERGNVWGDSRVSDGGLFPFSTKDGNRMGFREWLVSASHHCEEW